MIGAPVFKLCGGNINNSGTGAFRNQMHKAKKVLTGVTEAHTAADTGFIIGSAAGHVKGNHTLILVPDIYHTVYLFVFRSNLETR